MQLTRFTDLGLRVLMYVCGSEPGEVKTIGEITARFDISHNHLTKVVHYMGQQGWLINVRGKNGGIRLAQSPESYRLGELIRSLENNAELIDCATPPCALRGVCTLKNLLQTAIEAFYTELNRYTLADAISGPTTVAILQLHRLSAK